MCLNKLLFYSLVFLIVCWPISQVCSIRRYITRNERAESCQKIRISIYVDGLKTAYVQSRNKLYEWLQQEDALKNKNYAIVNVTDTNCGHYLSLVTYDKMAQMLKSGDLHNLLTAKGSKFRRSLFDNDLMLGLTEHDDGPFYPLLPNCIMQNIHRSIGGECYYANYTDWAAANIGYERILPPAYCDETNQCSAI